MSLIQKSTHVALYIGLTGFIEAMPAEGDVQVKHRVSGELLPANRPRIRRVLRKPMQQRRWDIANLVGSECVTLIPDKCS